MAETDSEIQFAQPLVDRLNRAVDANLSLLGSAGFGDMGSQIIKIQEEVGEVAEAYLGMHGANPRKGKTHTAQDLIEELSDVLVSTLLAAGVLGLSAEELILICTEKAEAWNEKARAAMTLRDGAAKARAVRGEVLPTND